MYSLVVFLAVQLTINAQGPNAPEAGSFEPVDAVDMVNLINGDFTYALPLLNIPSPEGGYPLALSYHAGIAMEQQASWVGLGWNVNPGAINRTISGYADDWVDAQTFSILYDKGGLISSFYIGSSISVGDYASFGGRLSYSENRSLNGGESSYRWDVDATASLGFKNSPFKLNGSIGSSGASLGVSLRASSGVASLSIHQNFRNGNTSFSSSIGFYGSSANRSFQGLGVSFNSASGNVSVTSQSINVSLNGSKNESNYSVNSESLDVALPILPTLNIDFGYSKKRYWLFDQQLNSVFGSLYSGEFIDKQNKVVNKSLVLSDAKESSYKYDSESQMEENNLSFISKDSYSVSAQGIGGSLSPDFYEVSTLGIKPRIGAKPVIFYGTNTGNNKNIYDSNDGTSSDTHNDLHFYFENSHSSYLKVKSGELIIPGSLNSIEDLIFNNQYSEEEVTVNGITHNLYNTNKRKKEGRFIEVFTNEEIQKQPTIIISPQNSHGFDRSNCPKEGIGAYKITALDGKTYHYSLPVYQKEEFNRVSEKDDDFELKFLERAMLTPYATHWLLTAITGPDYFDTNGNNILDTSDYGYWIVYEYGKWSEGIAWSGPSNQNITKNIEPTSFKSNNSKSYTWGIKESYYLNKIKTRTHTALFVKDVHGSSPSIDFPLTEKHSSSHPNDLGIIVLDGENFYKGFYDEGWSYDDLFDDCSCIVGYRWWEFQSRYSFKVNINEQKRLKLSKILLYKNEDIPNNLEQINNYSEIITSSLMVNRYNKYMNYSEEWFSAAPLIDINKTWRGQFFDNILDSGDINISGILNSKAIKTIEFKTDTRLANKYLTLNSVHVTNKAVDLIPPYKFDYVKKDLSYNYSKMDAWGYYKDNPDAWSLNKITTPLGARIKIAYESDDFDKRVSDVTEGFNVYNNNLQFTCTNSNGKLNIEINNETGKTDAIDFTTFFKTGSTKLDLWVGVRHDYYLPLNCQNRQASIDVNGKIVVTSVSSNKLTLEADLTSVYNKNAGVDYLYGYTLGTDYNPDHMYFDFPRGTIYNLPSDCSNTTLVLKYALTGNKILEDKTSGGIRVKQLELTDGIDKYFTNYYYNTSGSDKNQGDTNYQSSGVTSYEPSKSFQEIKYLSQLPSPGVMYGRVTVENTDNSGSSNFKTIYNFKTLDPSEVIDIDNRYSIGDFLDIYITDKKSDNINIAGESEPISYKKYKVTKNYSSLGQLISKEVINSENQVLSRIKNSYKLVSEINQGIHQESFNVLKKVNNSEYLVNTTSIISYPSVLNSTVVNQGGFNTTTSFDTYDFLTGQVLETHTTASDGVQFKTKSVPAYHISEYGDQNGFSMGSKTDSPDNKNMLTQEAANYTILIDEAGNEKVVSANITTWNDAWNYFDYTGGDEGANIAGPNIWRKHKNYIWNGTLATDGSYADFTGEHDGFEWGVGVVQPNNSEWKQTSETTLYDHFSTPLEMKDINGNRASTKMGDDDSKIIATANSAYTEMFYSGAEYIAKDDLSTNPDYFDGEVSGAAKQSSDEFHTGKYSVLASSGNKAFEVTLRASTNPATKPNEFYRPGLYRVSVWVHKTAGIIVNNTNEIDVINAEIEVGTSTVAFNKEESLIADNWVLLNGTITIPAGGSSVAIISKAAVYFDDFRLHPVSSSMTSYVYNEWDELSYIIGANGLATHYEYNSQGALVKTSVEVANFDIVENGITTTVGGFREVSNNRKNNKK